MQKLYKITKYNICSFACLSFDLRPFGILKAVNLTTAINKALESTPQFFWIPGSSTPSAAPILSVSLALNKNQLAFKASMCEWDVCAFHLSDISRVPASCTHDDPDVQCCPLCRCPLQRHYVIAPLHRNALNLILLKRHNRDFYLKPALTCI